MSDDVAIKVEGVSKTFKLPHERNTSLKSAIIKFHKINKNYDKQKVLNNVSFEIKKGEFFGIVGRNGSGKSTLLKLISQIYTPDKGSIVVNGKLTPFIELGVGFNPELSGRENVFLNGALLGFNRKEMEAMYDKIVEFAELERFMDQKLKNYSSGMQVRLAFSIAIRANTDILVLDEVLAVGDEAFQRKCYRYFAELKRNKKTVILVTHNMDHVQQFCTKAMLLNNGSVVEIGTPAKVSGRYTELNSEGAAAANSSSTSENHVTNSRGISAKVKVKNTNQILAFDIEIKTTEDINDAVITLMINRDGGEVVYRWASEDRINPKITISKNTTVKLRIELENIFPDAEFDAQLAIKKNDRTEVYALFNRVVVFRLNNTDSKRIGPHWRPKEKFSYEQN